MFDKYISEFHESIEGLKEFVELINPFLSEYEEKVFDENADSLRPIVLAMLKNRANNEAEAIKYGEELKSIFDGEIEVVEKRSDKGDVLGTSFKFISGDSSNITSALDNIAKTTKQKEQLYKSSLISLLSSVEWFFSQILHFYYDKFPESAGIKNKTLKLEDIKSFGSIEDAENYLIDSKIEEILRSSFKDWIGTLKSELSLGVGYVKDFENELIEIYQRRNLIIHNGGKVNSIYLSKVSIDNQEKREIGDVLNITKEYLESAIDKLHLVFTLIACELWKKLEPENEERGNILMSLGYDYLVAEKWSIAEIANVFLIGDKKAPIVCRTSAQLNYWLCKKRQGRWKDIEKEVKEADYSDKSLIFQIGFYGLTEDSDKFFRLVHHAVNNDEISVFHLFEFPILKEVREHPDFEKFKSENVKVSEYVSVQKDCGNTSATLVKD
ncbi:hypothetical protein MUN84_19475 [Hymenobacter sp. 5516J-16]|uniref:hypothetical protein n=1 Tax=Hymenobacter sp. 5516J-16 TaxID=2932253 RepID=UPI001FD1D859|nr:hypothetical protein [Hymenobacter sp. 5516J-16]UOQ76678.1 hypothetical protein MUN84_19475 [Hymenobacter sp. 5516J-16]